MRRAKTRERAVSKASVVALFWCFSLCFFSICACLDVTTSPRDSNTKDWGRVHRRSDLGRVLNRRSLGGPGSYPPRCIGKCGRCSPCHPVHVTVPPGMPVTTEYYPEAWRCKCGNRLYSP